MIGYFLRRGFLIVPGLLVVASITFLLMHAAPGGPWDREKPIPIATQNRLNAKFGLDRPLWFNPGAVRTAWAQGVVNPFVLARASVNSQFFNYMIGAMHGDLGPSYQSKGTESVQAMLRIKFPASAKTGLVALTFALLVGIPLGVIGALKQNTWADYLSLFVATIGVSVPTFIIGVLLIIFLSSNFGVTPIRRPEEWIGFGPAYILPGIVLGLGPMALITRLTRSSMLEIKRQDYIRTARAKGLGEPSVIWRHMLRNGMIPVVTILGPAFADLVTGSFII